MKERSGYYFDPVRYEQSERVMVMSWQADLVYRRLLDKIWIQGSIPDDPAQVSALYDIPLLVMEEVWPQIRPALSPTKKNPLRLTQEVLEAERKKRDKFYKDRKNSGKVGGQKSAILRKQKQSQPLNKQGDLEVTSSIPQPIPSPSSSTSTSKEKHGERAPRSKPKTEPPKLEDFTITPEMHKWAANQSPPFTVEDINRETPKMLDHFTGSGGKKADWISTWRNWMRNSPKYAPQSVKKNTGGMIEKPTTHNTLHFCGSCEIPHEWICEDELCNRSRDALCPEFIEKYNTGRTQSA